MPTLNDPSGDKRGVVPSTLTGNGISIAVLGPSKMMSLKTRGHLETRLVWSSWVALGTTGGGASDEADAMCEGASDAQDTCPEISGLIAGSGDVM